MLQRFMSEQNSDNISSSVEQLLTSQRLAEALRARHSSNDPKSGPPERRRSADGKSGGVLERQGGSEGSNGSNGDAVAAPGTPEASGRSKARREETSSFESVQSIKEADSAAFQPGSGRSESQNIMAMVGRPPSHAIAHQGCAFRRSSGARYALRELVTSARKSGREMLSHAASAPSGKPERMAVS